MLYLVRHGRPLVDRTRPPHEWELDPTAYDDVWALRVSGRLPTGGVWFTSPEPKAVATAQLLTDGDVGVLEGLREHVRETTEWLEDFDDAVRRAFAVPDAVAVPGWEPLTALRERVVRTVEGVLAADGAAAGAADGAGDVVLVGHGTAWTVLAAALTGAEPDLDRWRAPDARPDRDRPPTIEMMSTDKQAVEDAPEAPAADGAEGRKPSWWHRDHPTFAALSGFFTGLLFVALVPAIYVGILSLMFDNDRVEELFPFVLVTLVVPLGLVASPRTRRFGTYFWIGMVLTAIVVVGVGALVLWFLVEHQS